MFLRSGLPLWLLYFPSKEHEVPVPTSRWRWWEFPLAHTFSSSGHQVRVNKRSHIKVIVPVSMIPSVHMMGLLFFPVDPNLEVRSVFKILASWLTMLHEQAVVNSIDCFPWRKTHLTPSPTCSSHINSTACHTSAIKYGQWHLWLIFTFSPLAPAGPGGPEGPVAPYKVEQKINMRYSHRECNFKTDRWRQCAW